MKITRRQLKRLISESMLKEFRDLFGDDGIGGTDNITPDITASGGGGGRKPLHQLIKLPPGGYDDPNSYISVDIRSIVDDSGVSEYSKMLNAYDTLSPQSQTALYSMTPGQISSYDEDSTNVILDAYRNMTYYFKEKLGDAAYTEYEYFTVYHPNYVNPIIDQAAKLKVYSQVTGYTADVSAFEKYELVMHSAGALI